MTFLSKHILLLPTSVSLQAVEQALWKQEYLVAAVLAMPTLSPCAVIPRAGVLAGGTCPWEQALLYQPQEFSYLKEHSAKKSPTGREPGEILCTRNFSLRSLHAADTTQTAVMGRGAVASCATIRTK